MQKYKGAKLISLLSRKGGRYCLSYKFNDGKSIYNCNKNNYLFFSIMLKYLLNKLIILYRIN